MALVSGGRFEMSGKSLHKGNGRQRDKSAYFNRQLIRQSVGSLSSRSPLKTGCRRPPAAVFCMYLTVQTSTGSIQTALLLP